MMHTLLDRLSPYLWPLAVANLLANIGIVVTGAAVRLTGSGLGCPTWPRCTDASYVAHGELGIHGAIEFGNRMLTFVLTAVAILCFLAAVGARHRRATRLSLVVGLGIPLRR
jgi:cytochrome c oxidase assembly protein subunit 15